jgi:hypothetical protein
LICVTPIKNESSNLEHFLKATGVWADHMLVLDQGSTDNSVAIARRFEKVKLLRNESAEYDERHRAGKLIDAAREISGRRIIFALDADELLSANFRDSPEWGAVLTAQPGTVIRIDRLGLHPDGVRYWVDIADMPIGFVDDGSPFTGTIIHTTRIPLPERAPVLKLSEIKLLHLAYLDVAKLDSKVRWYQCWEALKGDGKLLPTYRYYHSDLPDTISRLKLKELSDTWTDRYSLDWINKIRRRSGDHALLPASEPTGHEVFWWDAQVLEWMRLYGVERFRRVPIWHVDWKAICKALGMGPCEDIEDPRTWIDRAVHRWLWMTRAFTGARAVRVMDRLIWEVYGRHHSVSEHSGLS